MIVACTVYTHSFRYYTNAGVINMKPSEKKFSSIFQTELLLIRRSAMIFWNIISKINLKKVCACIRVPGPEVIKLFPCSTQLSTKFQLLKKQKYRQMKKCLALSLSDVVFIMLTNVLTLISRIKFCTQLSRAWKTFYNLGAWIKQTSV